MKHLLTFLLLMSCLPGIAFAAGTVTITRAVIEDVSGVNKLGQKVTFTWTSTAGGAADSSVVLRGFLVKVVTNPSATAPTDDYDIHLYTPEDAAVDALGNYLIDRDTATTEVLPSAGGSVVAIAYLNGTYTFDITNAGAAKSGVATFYLLNP